MKYRLINFFLKKRYQFDTLNCVLNLSAVFGWVINCHAMSVVSCSFNIAIAVVRKTVKENLTEIHFHFSTFSKILYIGGVKTLNIKGSFVCLGTIYLIPVKYVHIINIVFKCITY